MEGAGGNRCSGLEKREGTARPGTEAGRGAVRWPVLRGW